MPQMTTSPAAPIATLEIDDRRLPARMVAGRLRADLPRPVPLVAIPSRRRLLLTAVLLMLAVPVVSATCNRQAA